MPNALLLALLALSAGPNLAGRAQDPAGAERTPEPASAPAGTKRQDAEAVIERAVAAQLGDSEPAPVQGFYVLLNLRLRGEQVQEIQFSQWYHTQRGGLLRQIINDPDVGVRVEKGFDGRRFWQLTLEGEKVGEFLDLSSRNYIKDREKIFDSMLLSEKLALILDLEQLQVQANDLAVKAADGGHLVTGWLELGDEPWRFELLLRGDDYAAHSLRLDPLPLEDEKKRKDDERAPQRFLFFGHHPFEGRKVPRRIDVFLGAQPGEAPDQILEIRELKWRQPPPLEIFRAPEPAE